MKKLMVITDADQRGSGYWHLSIPLLQGLAELGYEIKVIGFQYKGEEHWWDFSILPAQDMQDVVATARNLETLWKPDVLIVLLDIPLQEQFLQHFQTRTYKYVGIFPVEAPPLCMDWAMAISQMDKALVISEFGAKEVQKMGIDAEHIQIGIDLDSWKAPTPEQRQELRDNFGLDDDVFVILTVADNQERKNLSRALEIVADFTYDHYPVTKEWLAEENPKPARKVQYIMVTREHFWAGWKLRSYAQELGISLQLSIFERGISHQELWGLYSIADAFLLTSKAEGLGMPILEAMAMKVPVVCTNATAMQELIGDGKRGFPIDYWSFPNFDDYTDPFGNGLRYFSKRRSGLQNLRVVVDGIYADRVKAGYDYVSNRTHQISVEQLHKALQSLL